MELERSALKALIKESIKDLKKEAITASTGLEKMVAAGGGDPNKPEKPEEEEKATLAAGSGATQANAFVSKLKPLMSGGAAAAPYQAVMKLDIVGRINTLALLGDELLQIPKEELVANLSKLASSARAQKPGE